MPSHWATCCQGFGLKTLSFTVSSPTFLPTYIDMDITQIWLQFAYQLHGAAGLGGANAHAVSY